MKKTIKTTFILILGAMLATACSEAPQTEEHTHDDEMHDHQVTDEMHDHSEMTTKYACPMKCEGDKTYEEAGECPVCHMELKEVK